MSGWDRGNVYSVDIVPNDRSDNIRTIKAKCDAFFENFRIDNEFVYREQIRRNANLSIFAVNIELKHLYTFDEILSDSLQKDPMAIIGLLEISAQNLAQKMCESEEEEKAIDVFQVLLSSPLLPTTIRLLSSQNLGQIVRVAGIVVNASACLIKPTRIHAVCRSCMNHVVVSSTASFERIALPRTCQGSSTDTKQIPCPLDPFVVIPEQSKFIDLQILKIQETNDAMLPGEMPCSITATVSRTLVNRLAPGSRVIITGIYSVSEAGQNKKTAIRQPYLHVIDVENSEDKKTMKNPVFSEEKESEFQKMAKDPNIYERIIQSIAPSIYGNEDIKQAISCLLFGGSRKLLPDGIKIRGDINVLLLGDPGTAKSQFLKFVQKVAPISVYTSGKGSSAAGLTASVIRDPRTGGFYLEGGAMVLADGGVVCIDEFDKMNEEDRVAIHEAMEQQTISIAKAGITTVLNTRTSVLAAANPAFGRYDEMHTSDENIDFPTTILSRFDMIFIIKDEHSVLKDTTLARHVLAIHMGSTIEKTVEGEIEIERLQEYIAYARTKCAPRISMGAAEKLGAHYVGLRKEVRRYESELHERSTIPITVRQLEAITRISEALAKTSLSPIATEEHVEQALHLFKISTMAAVVSGHTIDGVMRPEVIREVERIERDIKKRMAIGSSIGYQTLVREFTETNQYNERAILKAVDIMTKQGKLSFQNQRKILIRQS